MKDFCNRLENNRALYFTSPADVNLMLSPWQKKKKAFLWWPARKNPYNKVTPWDLSIVSNLICGCSPAESLIVHQLGYARRLSAHSTAGLLWPQLYGPEFGILSVKHHQLLPTGSCGSWSRKRLWGKSITARRDSGVRPTTQSGELGTIVVQCQMSALGITMHEQRTRKNTMYSHQQVYKNSPLTGKWEISRVQT